VVEQLRNLLSGPLRALVLGGHPHLAGFLQDLLPDGVAPGLDGLDRAGGRILAGHLVLQLGEEVLEAFHGRTEASGWKRRIE
jgi:hypothetical protein